MSHSILLILYFPAADCLLRDKFFSACAFLLGLIQSCFPVLHNLRNGRTRLEAFQSSIKKWEVCFELDLVREKVHNSISRHEGRISIAEFIANQELFIPQHAIEDTRDASYLIDISIYSTGKYLGNSYCFASNYSFVPGAKLMACCLS